MDEKIEKINHLLIKVNQKIDSLTYEFEEASKKFDIETCIEAYTKLKDCREQIDNLLISTETNQDLKDKLFKIENSMDFRLNELKEFILKAQKKGV